MQVPSGYRMIGWIVDSDAVVQVEFGGLRGGGSEHLGCGGRSVMVCDTGRHEDEHAMASASTCKIPLSLSVHFSRLAST